ncbi:PREDICTED: zinc finger BED domain-containing [Prunus dulcis]|uniref:PREDICTED: zinc finger BED domain-containing n=1 Tax=Prunus dulcis TaxID=3755 RepID=A0A5E4FYI7_PRUDU|nr:PREDICTED: zinc finger BED domain-containing [Prunus dulcis]
MVIRDELPFSHVENMGFRDLMLEVQLKFDLHHLTSLVVVTAYFIDVDWHLHKRILSFCVIPNHKGESIGKLLESCLNDWGIEKVFAITVDNATPNDKMISYMKGMKELDSSNMAISNLVRYIHSSATRLANWRKCVSFENLDIKGIVPLDVCTRWNSTYLLLEGALKYQKAFERMLEDDVDPHFVSFFMDDDVEKRKKRVGPPTSNDWDCAKVLIEFLKLYYEATLKFSGSKVVTSHQVFPQMCAIYVQLQKFCASEDSLMKSIATSIKRKFDKYWGNVDDINKMLLIAIVLDP